MLHFSCCSLRYFTKWKVNHNLPGSQRTLPPSQLPDPQQHRSMMQIEVLRNKLFAAFHGDALVKEGTSPGRMGPPGVSEGLRRTPMSETFRCVSYLMCFLSFLSFTKPPQRCLTSGASGFDINTKILEALLYKIHLFLLTTRASTSTD